MDNYIKRVIESKVLASLDDREYIAIIGPRQAGKTTLLKRIQEHLLDRPDVDSDQVVLLTFQDPQLLLEHDTDPVRFIRGQMSESSRTFILIDEYQYAKNAGATLKLIYDTVPQAKIIITGSSSLELKKISSAMVGRIFRYELKQLSYSEIIQIQQNSVRNGYQDYQQLLYTHLEGKKVEIPPVPPALNRDLLRIYEEYSLYGGYPAVYTRESFDKKQEVLLNIYSTYVEKDVVGLLGLRNTELYFKLLKYLSVTIGTLSNNSSIQRDLGMHYEKLEEYLAALKHTYIIRELPPFFTNKLNEIKKTPKYYFFDTGLRNWIIRSFQPLSSRTDRGHLMENVVMHRLFDVTAQKFEYTDVKFWRKNTGTEVDFTIETSGDNPQTIPVEMKYQNFTEPTLSRSYHSYLEEYQPRIGLVVTKDFCAQIQVRDTLVLFFPAFLM